MNTITQLRTDIYSRVTNKIIADLEQGVQNLAKAVERRAHERADHRAPPA